MPVDNPDVVDAIGIERATGVVVLTISDHLEWDATDDHARVLQEKINRYLGFVESGELLEQYPKALGKPVRIDVVCKHAPSECAERFLDRARKHAEGAGCSFAWRTPNA